MRIAEERRVRKSGHGNSVTQPWPVDRLYFAFATKPTLRGSLTLVLEHSDDGDEWSAAATFTFRARGLRGHVGSLAQAKDQLRVRWMVRGGRWTFSVDVGPVTEASKPRMVDYESEPSALVVEPVE
jgi:hypothetical protein